MVVSAAAPPVTSAQPRAHAELVESAIDASIAGYIESGARVYTLMDTGWKACAAFGVLLLMAWAIGALPGAIRLF